MAKIKHPDWPRVVKNDHGIRPAGNPDECFYCNRKIGEFHKASCIIVESLYAFDVYIGNEKVGDYQEYLPHYWNVDQIEFRMNLGTWCSDNALDAIKWKNGEAPKQIQEINFDEGCSCPILKFEFVGIIDAGPFADEPWNDERADWNNKVRDMWNKSP